VINEKPPYVGAAKNRQLTVVTRELESARTVPNPVGPRMTAWANGTISQFSRNRRITPLKAVPWKLSTFVDTGPVYKVFVRVGLVNNFIPTIDVSGTQVSLDTVPAPALVVTGASGIVYLKATVDAANLITAVEVLNGTSTPTDTATAKHRTIGTWTIADGAFTSVSSVLNTNQTLYLCNGTAIWEG